jgi:hypothetical protein
VNRYRASLIHFGLSVGVALIVFAVLRFLWYPGPLFGYAGGLELLAVITTVDVTIGPIITLIVFVPGKRGLKFDLATIALLQLAALAFGLHALAESRPVWITFVKDRFELVRAIDIDDADRAKATPEFRGLSWFGPVYAGARKPRDPQEQLRMMDSAILGGKDLYTYPEFYVSYASVAGEVAAHARPLDELRKHNPEQPEAVGAIARGLGRPEAELGFLPMRAGKVDMTVVVDRRSGAHLALSPLKPWEY